MNDPSPGVCESRSPYVSQPLEPARAETVRTLERATGIIGRTHLMRMLREQIIRFAKTTATVVVRGETGTGKELVAQALHTHSLRSHGPFVAANVAALTTSVLQSELFGHERGAFTGAHTRHRGLFEQAHRGTLFLDEVGELSIEAQAALLRILETREVRPVGAERAKPIDVRLVVATHRSLIERVQKGYFREDLFYRLNTLVVRIPPLRQRVSDLPALARHILTGLVPEVGERALAEDALHALGDYGWPGNVRQFQNVLRRAAIESDATLLTREHVGTALAHEVGAERETIEGATIATISQALAAEGWNLTRAARRLGLARSTLRSHIRRAGLVPSG